MFSLLFLLRFFSSWFSHIHFATRAGWNGWCSSTRFWIQKSISFVVSELCPRQSSKCDNSKLRQGKVTVHCIAPLLNEIYITTCARHVVSICSICSQLLQGHAATLTFKVATQMFRSTRRLNMLIIYVKYL
jgi:hypothetical protein